ncbi:MAG: MFS transporter, partial [Spirochaetaceae bacterium]
MPGIPSELPSLEIQRGQRLVRRFAALNGVSVVLLMDSMLILYAIRNGVGDSALAVLASFIHLTMPLMIVGKHLTARIGAARTWGLGWVLRNLSVLILVVAPFLPADAPQWVRTAIILTGGFGFAAFRAVGLVGNSPVIGEITTGADRGRFISGNWIRTTAGQLLTLVVVIIVLNRVPQTWVFQMLIGFGGALGIYVGWVLSHVPESTVPRHSARKPLSEVLSRVWHLPSMRKTLYAWASGIAAFTVVIPFALITVKNGYGLSDYEALSLSLVTLSGGMLASMVNSIIADRVGPRPLIIIYVAVLALVGVFWATAPAAFHLMPTLAAFFLAGYSKFGLIVAINHYFLSVVEGGDRVGSAMVMRIVSGAAAGLIGAVIGGGILGLLHSLGFEGMDVYRIYFSIAALGLLLLVPVVRRLDRLVEWRVRDAALLLLRPWRIVRMRR